MPLEPHPMESLLETLSPYAWVFMLLCFALGCLLAAAENPFSTVSLPRYLHWTLMFCLVGGIFFTVALFRH